MLNNFLQVVGATFASLFLLVSSPFVSKTEIPPTPSPTPTVIEQNVVKAVGTYFYQGYSVNIAMEFPKDGGTVKGTLDGDCAGTFDGNYASGENGDVTGKAQANCEIAIFKINAEATITGKVLLEQKKVNVDFKGKAGEFTHNGSLTLNFTN